MIRFSIITVCLNAGEDLIYTVNNLIQQEYNDFEIIVKDGLSKDGSIEKLPRNSKIKFIQCRDTGVYDAMNQAIKEATGDFCLFINAGDSLYERSTLEQIAEFISANEGDFYYGKSHTVLSDVIHYAPAKITKFFCYRTTMCHQAMVIKTLYLKQRGYETSYKISADREWMVYAFMKTNMRFVRMPIMVSNYKGGGISYGDAIVSVIGTESKRITKMHFSRGDRIKYGIMQAITFPGFRGKISRNPRFEKVYRNLRYMFLNK